MRLEKQTVELNKMQFLRSLGIDTSDASLVKLYQKDYDNSVVPWNTICSDKDGLYVETSGHREPVSVHFYAADSDEYEPSLRQENAVYTTDDLLKKLPPEIEGPMYSYYLDMESTEEGYRLSYPSQHRDVFNSEFFDGKTLKDAAYDTLLTLATEKVQVPNITGKGLEQQTLTHTQMESLRSLGIDTSDASLVKLFYKNSDNSIIDDSHVVPTEQGYITNEDGHSEEATAYFYASDSEDYVQSLRQPNLVYTVQDLLEKTPKTINLEGVEYRTDLSLLSDKEYRIRYVAGGRTLQGMTFTSRDLCSLLFRNLGLLAEKGLWKDDKVLLDGGIAGLLRKLAAGRDSGTVTLHDAAVELQKAGWSNFVDEEKTEQILRGWKAYNPSLEEDVSVVRSGSKVLVIGERNAILCYDNHTQQLPILSDLLSIHHVRPCDVRSWQDFLKGKTIALDSETAISLYKGVGAYTVKTFEMSLFLTKYVDSKDIIIRNADSGKVEELRYCTVDLKVKDNVFLSLFYHVEHGNREIEDNYCTVKLPEALKAYNVDSMEMLKEKLGDGRLEGNTWNNLISDLTEKGLKPAVEESGKYLDVDESLIPEY